MAPEKEGKQDQLFRLSVLKRTLTDSGIPEDQLILPDLIKFRYYFNILMQSQPTDILTQMITLKAYMNIIERQIKLEDDTKAKNEIRIRHNKYEKNFKQVVIVSLVAFFAQMLAVYFLYCTMYNGQGNSETERKLPVVGWPLYAARMLFMMIITQVIFNDTQSVYQYYAINGLQLDAAGKKRLS